MPRDLSLETPALKDSVELFYKIFKVPERSYEEPTDCVPEYHFEESKKQNGSFCVFINKIFCI